ncbi:unnamed protein product [Nezara viridula]|uniref:Uncharacterized protein n=1 Tax=Nezara viridula TaxID=85310 RepID=A0A9P0HF85_NEZVI|nr:unnamed protein product [Nezara viridula]
MFGPLLHPIAIPERRLPSKDSAGSRTPEDDGVMTPARSDIFKSPSSSVLTGSPLQLRNLLYTNRAS